VFRWTEIRRPAFGLTAARLAVPVRAASRQAGAACSARGIPGQAHPGHQHQQAVQWLAGDRREERDQEQDDDDRLAYASPYRGYGAGPGPDGCQSGGASVRPGVPAAGPFPGGGLLPGCDLLAGCGLTAGRSLFRGRRRLPGHGLVPRRGRLRVRRSLRGCGWLPGHGLVPRWRPARPTAPRSALHARARPVLPALPGGVAGPAPPGRTASRGYGCVTSTS